MGSHYKKVAFHTFGCKLNYAETSSLSRDFIASGYAQVGFQEQADIYIINSCSVTENADKKTHKRVRQILKRSPNAKIVIIGCYAQLQPEKIKQIPGVSLIVGAEEKFNLIEHIELIKDKDFPLVINSNIDKTDTFHPSFSSGDRTRSFLKVQDGCNYTCSFCTIPLARGKSRSGTIAETINVAKKIAKNGTKEIVLTGVNIGDFGIPNGEDFLSLIKELEKIEGIKRYRISSIEPNLLTNEIIYFIKESKKFLPHFHIPLQSGSEDVLKQMRRRYTLETYKDRISKIKSLLPEASIGVDVIVGFPSETKIQFQETVSFLQDIDISYLHVFSYSCRENTDALSILPKVCPQEITRRSQFLHKLSEDKKNNFLQQNINKMSNVLIESYEEGFVSGFSSNYIKVKTKGDSLEVNTIMPLKMICVNENEMIGQRIN